MILCAVVFHAVHELHSSPRARAYVCFVYDVRAHFFFFFFFCVPPILGLRHYENDKLKNVYQSKWT